MAAFLQDQERPLLCIASGQVEDHIDLLSQNLLELRLSIIDNPATASAPLRSWSSARRALANVSLRRVAHDVLNTSFCRVHKKKGSSPPIATSSLERFPPYSPIPPSPIPPSQPSSA